MIAFSTDRFAHSPSTWGQMWKKAFAELYGPEFAESRVESTAYLRAETRRDSDGGVIPRSTLVWSVKIL